MLFFYHHFPKKIISSFKTLNNKVFKAAILKEKIKT